MLAQRLGTASAVCPRHSRWRSRRFTRSPGCWRATHHDHPAAVRRAHHTSECRGPGQRWQRIRAARRGQYAHRGVFLDEFAGNGHQRPGGTPNTVGDGGSSWHAETASRATRPGSSWCWPPTPAVRHGRSTASTRWKLSYDTRAVLRDRWWTCGSTCPIASHRGGVRTGGGGVSATVRERGWRLALASEEPMATCGIRTSNGWADPCCGAGFGLPRATMQPLSTALDRGAISMRSADRCLRIAWTLRPGGPDFAVGRRRGCRVEFPAGRGVS